MLQPNTGKLVITNQSPYTDQYTSEHPPMLQALLHILLASILLISVYTLPKPRLLNVLWYQQPYAFVHIPKTGGTAIKHWLKSSNHCPSIASYYHEETTQTAQFYQQHPITIIRDPIDRFLSTFYYWKYGSEDISAWRRPNNWHKADNIDTPEKLITILANKNHPQHQQTVRDILSNDHITWQHFLPQSHWINSPEADITFVCYHPKQLQQQLQHALDQLHIPCKIEQLPIKNQSRHKANHQAKLSPAAIQWLKQYYQKDFTLYQKYCQ